ncbi:MULTISPECIES: alpha-1,2-fucosyltransferase [Muribaculaceae]|jgi:hypothetical protein|uniref:alpha-1,2-fucosyltransferase n=1 Tax=Muribaculaceae TaxID=2005473 RepID=UPI002577FA10|nr:MULTISPECIES: alpha-1,2-fucosyltransferase [Muribaculaceae]
MKIINILGGLGNQMFQYAFAISLKAEFPDETIKLNTKCYKGYPLHNGFELDNIFKVDIPIATLNDLVKYSWPWIHYRLWQIGRRILPNRESMAWDTDFPIDFNYDTIKKKSYFDGYWQSPRFFEKHRNAVIKAMRFPNIVENDNLKVLNFINLNSTAFIHVRRGDYLNHPAFKGICDLNYYENGISILRGKYGFTRFLIFSNDITWCKKNLIKYLDECDVLFVDWNSGSNCYRDMQLMSMCNGALIANSSFSWWGAWLSNAHVVLCPTKWSNKPGHRIDIFPKDWINI